VIVLDTHVWVRWVDSYVNPLPASLVEQIESADALAISAVSCWEVAWLHRRGRMTLKLPLEVWIDNALQGSDVVCLPVDRHVALRSAEMPEHHRDPADRLIIATAVEHQAYIESLDQIFPRYAELAGRLLQY